VLGVLAGGVAAAVVVAVPALAVGSPWQTVAHPQSSSISGFGSVFTASRSQAWAVGFDETGATSQINPLIEHWNGTRWAVTPGAAGANSNGHLNAVGGTGPADVWAVGLAPNGGLIEHFNGTSWKLVSAGASPELGSISADRPTDAWAGSALNPPIIMHWNGTAWRQAKIAPVACYTCRVTSIAALSPSDVWAVGVGFSGGGHPFSFREHWDGSLWHLTLNPVVGSVDNAAVSGTSPTDVWAVYGVGGSQGVIEHFNGTTWTRVPNPAGSAGELASVAALSPTDAWAMSSDGALSEHWDGTAWQAVPTGVSIDFVLGEDSGGDYPGSPALSGIPGGPLFAVGASGMSAILEQPHP
jgi:hypothetical protein